jgi:hypothetical protein
MRLPLLVAVLLATSGCAIPFMEPKIEYAVTYYDRNHDGKVDFELHHAVKAADADWALCDTHFRGRYDLRIRYSVGVVHEPVSLPVPTHVPIAPGRPPVYKIP